MTRYIVMHRAAKMPATVKAPYRRVAVIEVDSTIDGEPRMISKRAKGVRRIVRTWERCHKGWHPGGNTAFEVALREAEGLAHQLNEARHE